MPSQFSGDQDEHHGFVPVMQPPQQAQPVDAQQNFDGHHDVVTVPAMDPGTTTWTVWGEATV